MPRDAASHCEEHLKNLIFAAEETGGAFWPSIVDIQTRRCREADHIPRRVYRLIGAPRGGSLYWDQPTIVAAHILSSLTGKPGYAKAADRYLTTFLSSCISENGLFRWGNHTYYDLFERQIVDFNGGYHELRPITPAWELFWLQSPEKTARYIRKMAELHVYDPSTGGFNRHDDQQKSHAFLEAGGILCESLAWLYSKSGHNDLSELALKIACYSFDKRHPGTLLVPNEPDMGRWDSEVCTTEIGLWAQCLIRAADYTQKSEFLEMAEEAVAAFLRYAYEEKTGRYFGQIRISDGVPSVPAEVGYWPQKYANPWSTDQWPTHDYPMSLAEACLSLHQITGKSLFVEAVQHLAKILDSTRSERLAVPVYAESYGRAIHFLNRAGIQLSDPSLLAAAETLADEAVQRLWNNGMFEGYPESGVYESVDGVGFLLLALLSVETRSNFDLMGFGF